MGRKEAIAKALVWRFLIAIPVSLIVNYLFIGNIATSINLAIVGNFIGTVLYYLYDRTWFRYRKIND
jgi:uncharacterized membrane protein